VGRAAVGQLQDPLYCGVAALGDRLGRAERPCDVESILVVSDGDDPLGAEPAGREDAAEPDRAVADNDAGVAGADPRADRSVVAGPHHRIEEEAHDFSRGRNPTINSTVPER
jgi:hypothetical protein